MRRARQRARTRRLVRSSRLGVVVAIIAASLVVGWTSASPYASALKRYPYVTEVVGNSATVNWATDRSQTTGTVTWGAVVNGQCTPSNSVTATRFSITVNGTPEYQWSAVLNFPSAGTYCYRVQLGALDLLDTDASPRVTTAAPPGSSFSFAVFGDWGAGTTDQANVMSRIGASPASFVATVGDNVYNSGSETEYGDLTQGNVFRPQFLPALGGKPIFAAEGNHGFSTNLPVYTELPGAHRRRDIRRPLQNPRSRAAGHGLTPPAGASLVLWLARGSAEPGEPFRLMNARRIPSCWRREEG